MLTTKEMGFPVDSTLVCIRWYAACPLSYRHDVPRKFTTDKSGANKAGIDKINSGRKIPILVCQLSYLNNIIEQDHRAVNA